MEDPLLSLALWRLLAHAVVPILIAASTSPEGSNSFRVGLSIFASAVIELFSQVGVDLSQLVTDPGMIDMDEAGVATGLGVGGQQVAYKVVDSVLPDHLKLNELVLPAIGIGGGEDMDQ